MRGQIPLPQFLPRAAFVVEIGERARRAAPKIGRPFTTTRRAIAVRW